MTDDDPAHDTFPYPQGSVVAIIGDQAALDAARDHLGQAGLGPERCDVLHGEAGLARIDVDGEAHGRSGGLLRRLQSALSDDADHARRYADELRAGHYVVGVAVGEDEAAKARAAEALRASGGEFINYYAENYVEDLGS